MDWKTIGSKAIDSKTTLVATRESRGFILSLELRQESANKRPKVLGQIIGLAHISK